MPDPRLGALQLLWDLQLMLLPYLDLALGVVQQLQMNSMQSQKHMLVVVQQLMPKLLLQLNRVQHLMP